MKLSLHKATKDIFINHSTDFAEIQYERPPPESARQFQFSAILMITRPGLNKTLLSLVDVTVTCTSHMVSTMAMRMLQMNTGNDFNDEECQNNICSVLFITIYVKMAHF